MFANVILPISLLVASVMAAPTPAPVELSARQDSAPATVHFTPYEYVGCRQSQNPYSSDKPTSYNVTSGTCYTSSYGFSSYVESTNFNPSTTPCALSIFPEADCQGQGEGATLSTYAQCVADLDIVGMSFELACGP